MLLDGNIFKLIISKCNCFASYKIFIYSLSIIFLKKWIPTLLRYPVITIPIIYPGITTKTNKYVWKLYMWCFFCTQRGGWLVPIIIWEYSTIYIGWLTASLIFESQVRDDIVVQAWQLYGIILNKTTPEPTFGSDQ